MADKVDRVIPSRLQTGELANWNCEVVEARHYDQLRQRLADEERLARHHSGMAEAYGIENDELRTKLALAEQECKIFKTAFLLMNAEYDPIDNLCGNGCWHGFKPAKNCPNKNCKDAALHKAIDAAIAGSGDHS